MYLFNEECQAYAILRPLYDPDFVLYVVDVLTPVTLLPVL